MIKVNGYWIPESQEEWNKETRVLNWVMSPFMTHNVMLSWKRETHNLALLENLGRDLANGIKTCNEITNDLIKNLDRLVDEGKQNE